MHEISLTLCVDYKSTISIPLKISLALFLISRDKISIINFQREKITTVYQRGKLTDSLLLTLPSIYSVNSSIL